MDDLTLTSAPSGTTLELQVSGMTCTGCSTSVEGALAAVAGVRAASVDHATGIAVVLLDPAVDPEGFAFDADAAVHDAGYTLEAARVAVGARSGGCGCGGGGCGGNGSGKQGAAAAPAVAPEAAPAPVAPKAAGECCGGGGCA